MNRVSIHGANKAELVRKLRAYKPPAKPYIPCPCIFCAAQHKLIKSEMKARIQ